MLPDKSPEVLGTGVARLLNGRYELARR